MGDETTEETDEATSTESATTIGAATKAVVTARRGVEARAAERVDATRAAERVDATRAGAVTSVGTTIATIAAAAIAMEGATAMGAAAAATNGAERSACPVSCRRGTPPARP